MDRLMVNEFKFVMVDDGRAQLKKISTKVIIDIQPK